MPISPVVASWLTELRSDDVPPDAPVFPSKTGAPLSDPNVYRRVLLPGLINAGIALKVGEGTVRKRDKEVVEPMCEMTGVGFHAFRKACGSLLRAHGRTSSRCRAGCATRG